MKNAVIKKNWNPLGGRSLNSVPIGKTFAEQTDSHQESTLKHFLVEAAWIILPYFRDDMDKEIRMLRSAWLRQSLEGQC